MRGPNQLLDSGGEVAAAAMLGALGNETRLRIFRLLVRRGEVGLNVGEIQSRLHIPASTLAHHLGTLKQAGLVLQTRRGREVLCAADYVAIDGLMAYLTEECCAELDTTPRRPGENAKPLVKG